MSTLYTFRPKSCKLLNTVENVDKLNPVLKISINGKAQTTETAVNGGKNPTWRTPLTFNVSGDDFAVFIEVLHEQSSTELRCIGGLAYKLSELTPGKITTLDLFNDLMALIGTLEIELEVEDSKVPENVKNKKDVKETGIPNDCLILKIKSASLVDKLAYFVEMEPFVQVTVAEQTLRTGTVQFARKFAKLQTFLTFKLTPQQINNPTSVQCLFELYDKKSETQANLIGSASYNLGQVAQHVNVSCGVKDLENKDVAHIELGIQLGAASSEDGIPEEKKKIADEKSVPEQKKIPENGLADLAFNEQKGNDGGCGSNGTCQIF